MSQTSPNRADQTTTNRSATNTHVIKPLSISGHAGDHRTIAAYHLQPQLISPLKQVEYPRWTRRRWPKCKANAVALALACLTLPLLANRTSAYDTNQPIAQTTQVQQVRATAPAEISPKPRIQEPLTLMIETAVAVLLLLGLIAAYLATRAMRPIQTAAKFEKLDKGELNAADIEFPQLPTQFVRKTPSLLEQQQAEPEQAQLLKEITGRLRASVDLEGLLQTTVKEVRRVIKADRVFVYRFNSDWSGNVVAEAVAPGWPSCLKIKVSDTYFTESHPGVEQYKSGRVCVINDIYTAGISECHLNLLEQFAVRAHLSAAIMKNDELLGLMIAHHCSAPRTWEKYDVDLFVQLTKQVGAVAAQVSFLEQQQAEAERTQVITEITLRIRQSLYLEDILKTAVKEVRRVLKTDRVVIYGLDQTNWDGVVIAESVAHGWPQMLKVRIYDPCFKERHLESYKSGKVRAINDIHHEPGLSDCHINMLDQFAVKANLVAPILRNNQLLGLMIAHHCSATRTWQQLEIDLFVQLATQVGLAIDQVNSLEQMEYEQ